MWLKVLSLFIFCSLSFGVSTSSFAHGSMSGNIASLPLIGIKAQAMEQSERYLISAYKDICLEDEKNTAEIACCHIDTCSAFFINRLKDPSFSQYLDPHPVMIHWPFKPISNLKKPPKPIAV